MKLSKIEFKDLMNNIGLPDVADKLRIDKEDVERIEEQHLLLTREYGESYTNSFTGETCSLLLEKYGR